ncbi:MAG: hypothetical protein ACOCUH_03505, partial [Bacteriovoracia bacterium]
PSGPISKAKAWTKNQWSTLWSKINELTYPRRLQAIHFMANHGPKTSHSSFNYRLARMLDAGLKGNGSRKFVTMKQVEKILKDMNSDRIYEYFQGINKGFDVRGATKLAQKETTAKIVNKIWSKNPQVKQRYREIFNGLFVDNHRDLNLLYNSFTKHGKSLPTDLEKINELEEFITYANRFPSVRRRDIYRQVDELFDPSTNAKYVKKFRKTKSKINQKADKYQEKRTKHHLEKLLKEKGLDDYYNGPQPVKLESLKKQAGQLAKKDTDNYRFLRLRCQARAPSPQRKFATGQFKRFALGVSIASSVLMYAFVNWDKEKDAKWYGKISYDLMWGIFFRVLTSAIVTNPNDPNWIMMSKSIGVGTFFDAFEAFGFVKIFAGATNEEIEKQFEKVKNDRELMARVDEIISYLENDEEIRDYIDQLLTTENGIPREMTVGDLEDNYLYDHLMEGIASQVDQDKMIKRYTFHRFYSISYGAASGLLVGKWVYNILCHNKNNPALGLVKALGVFAAEKVVSKLSYYAARSAYTGE